MEDLERRLHERICIDAPVFCEITIEGQKVPVLLKDISKGGLQVEIGPGREFSKELLGSKISLTTLPDELSMRAPDVSGMVSWLSEERLGIRFPDALPLSQEELEDIIRRC